MDSGRLEAFSDGVLAVAITLLALDLVVAGPGPGHPALSVQLHGKWPSFAAYFVSFLTIGVVWVNHHNLFRNIAVVDRILLFTNLILLLFVVLIPFVTATLAAYLSHGGPSAHLAAVLYCVVLECMALSFVAIFVEADRRGLLAVPLEPETRRAATLRFGAGTLAYAGAIGVAVVSAPLALLASGLIAVYYMFEQSPARRLPTTGG